MYEEGLPLTFNDTGKKFFQYIVLVVMLIMAEVALGALYSLTTNGPLLELLFYLYIVAFDDFEVFIVYFST